MLFINALVVTAAPFKTAFLLIEIVNSVMHTKFEFNSGRNDDVDVASQNLQIRVIKILANFVRLNLLLLQNLHQLIGRDSFKVKIKFIGEL